MNPVRVIGWACAIGLWAACAAPVHAGWHNVFQVCCHSCGTPSVSHYAPVADPCCNPCPQVCTTRYVQRCFYQPVTSYVTRSFYEAVTTYRTSFYWEPVTTVRYTSFFDPCTCAHVQVPCTSTSYQLRSQCCPVQSWVQRCVQQPVVSYRQCSYWEPVTTCANPCAPAPAVAAPAPAPAVAVTPAAPPTTEPPPAAQPGVSEGRIPAQAPQMMPPGVRDSRTPNGSGSPLYDTHYPRTNPPTMPNASGSSLRPQPLPVRPPAPAPARTPPPQVKLEQIVSAPAGSATTMLASAGSTPVWTPKKP
jgi:hypothetical protein